MGNTAAIRHHFWVGKDFAAHSMFQSNKVITFTCMYIIPTLEGFHLKERVWENGILLSSKELAIGLTSNNASQMFQTTMEQFKARVRNEAHKKKMRLLIQTRSPLRWRKPEMGKQITSLGPIEAYFSGSEGLPVCFFEPGDVGIVVSVDMPAVRHTSENPSDLFACVDFEKPGFESFEGPNQCTWRCHLYYHHAIPLSVYPNGNDTLPSSL